MRVKELKLHNFRGIKDLHLVFNTEHNVVVLAGINGVGKSSILDSIDQLFHYYIITCYYYHPYYDGDLRYHVRYMTFRDYENILVDSDVRNNEKDSCIQISVGQEQDAIEWIVRNKDRTNWENTNDSSIANITKNRKLEISNNYFYYLSNRQSIDSRKILPESLKIEPLVYGRSENEIPEIESIINFNDFSQWFKDTEDLENERRLSGDIQYRHSALESVRTAIYKLLGNSYENLRFKRDLGKLTIKKSSKEITLNSLSDGEKSLIAMVGHLSRRLAENSEQATNPLEAEAIVLIDEIELHLHPAWQRSIIPRLTQTFPNCQFIVTTHSPQVLSHVDPECIHVLDYDEDNNVVVKRPDSSYGLDSNRILEDILDVPKRPQEIQERMSDLFVKINNNELEAAKAIVRELAELMKTNDEPELIKAEATIRRRETIGR